MTFVMQFRKASYSDWNRSVELRDIVVVFRSDAELLREWVIALLSARGLIVSVVDNVNANDELDPMDVFIVCIGSVVVKAVEVTVSVMDAEEKVVDETEFVLVDVIAVV